MKRGAALLFMAVLVITSVFANGRAEEASENEFVELKMYLVGDTVPDYDMMLDELNVLMEEDINASLDVNFTTWVDWQTKLRLILSSGEKVDLVHMAPWGIYSEQAQAGSLMDIRNLAPTYAPETWNSYNPDILKQTEINGGVYMMPFRYTEPIGQGIVYRKDLAKKYGINEVNSTESLMALLKAVHDNEAMVPFNAGEFDLTVWIGMAGMIQNSRPQSAFKVLLENTEGVIAYVNYDQPETILYDYESAYYKETMDFMRTMYNEELIPRNVLSNTIGSREAFLAGKSAMTTLNPLNANEEFQKIQNSNPEWELGYWLPMTTMASHEKAPAINNGMSIPTASENPERALMLLEKLHQDQRYHDLTTYGVQGVHWELTSDGEITAPQGLDLSDSGFQWDRPCPWGWREEKFYRLNVLKSPSVWGEVKASQETMYDIGVERKWTDFTFDKSNVSTEISALNTVRTGVFSALSWGLMDVEEGYQELIDDYDNAGIETVKQELEDQWSAYLAGN
ncbi:MAG: extracellular solute-binding protein [Spirochaetales bacterium]|nr:extracellular solute-binding protein [Spirochaetales bacterium]